MHLAIIIRITTTTSMRRASAVFHLHLRSCLSGTIPAIEFDKMQSLPAALPDFQASLSSQAAVRPAECIQAAQTQMEADDMDD